MQAQQSQNIEKLPSTAQRLILNTKKYQHNCIIMILIAYELTYIFLIYDYDRFI